MTSLSAGHIILKPTQPVGSGRPQRGLNPGPPHQYLRALSSELTRPPLLRSYKDINTDATKTEIYFSGTDEWGQKHKMGQNSHASRQTNRQRRTTDSKRDRWMIQIDNLMDRKLYKFKHLKCVPVSLVQLKKTLPLSRDQEIIGPQVIELSLS